MEYHPTVNKIKNLLIEKNAWFETFEHEPVRTSEEAVKTRPGYALRQGAKAIIIRARIPKEGKKFYMIVLPADQKFSNEKVKQILGVKDIRFATAEESAERTNGIEFGGVPPFGNLFNLEVIVDESLFHNEKIVFNAGDKKYSIAMKSQDYKEIVKPTVKNII